MFHITYNVAIVVLWILPTIFFKKCEQNLITDLINKKSKSDKK